MHVDKWLLSAAWYCQNTFLILLLLSSNCKKCYLVSYKGLLHCCVSSFCLCSALLTLYEISLCHTALLGVADGAQPQSSTLLLLKAGKTHGLWNHLSGFQREAFNTKKTPKTLNTFKASFIVLKDTWAKLCSLLNSSALQLTGEQNQKWAFSLSL